MSVQNVGKSEVCFRQPAESVIADALCCWRRMVARRDGCARNIISEAAADRRESPLLAGARNKVRKGAMVETIYGLRGKHTANPPGPWAEYGASDIWEREVEKAITEAVQLIGNGYLTVAGMFDHFAAVRRDIALLRKNKEARWFGVRRDNPHNPPRYNGSLNSQCTPMSDDYRYALGRALTLPCDGVHYVQEAGNRFCRVISRNCENPGALRFGLVKGNIDGTTINLTQYIFSPPQRASRMFKRLFGFQVQDFEHIWPYGPVSGIWLHPEVSVFPACMQHIEALVEQALAGDLSVIPRIHWWSVHLSATWRGSGGMAEMMIKTVCRCHGHDLPPWREGVAPSIEVLLQPDEELFCSRYHKLFAGPVEFIAPADCYRFIRVIV